jgi:hypothetical protein
VQRRLAAARRNKAKLFFERHETRCAAFQ